MKRFRFKLFLLPPFLLVILLSGCSSQLFDYTQNNSSAISGFPITVTDQQGNTLTCDKPVSLVACYDNAALSLCAVLDIQDRVYLYYGTTKGALFQKLGIEVSSFPTAVPPDSLILFSSPMKGSSSLPSFYTGCSRLDETITTADQLSVVFEDSKSVYELGRYCLNLKAALLQKSGKVDFLTMPDVLFLSESDPHLALSSNADHVINDILDTLGCQNACPPVTNLEMENSFYIDVSVEKLKTDIIWIPFFAEYSLDSVLSDPIFQNTSAVKASHVSVFPSAIEPWYESSPAAYCGLCWALYDITPAQYSYEDLLTDVNGYYQTAFGLSFSDREYGFQK